MKKLSIVSMIGAAALSALALTGCPTTNPDAEYLNSAQAIFACGNTAEFGSWTLNDGPEFENEGNNIFTYEFEATGTEEQFKILVDNRDWSYQAHNGPAPIVLGEEETWVVSDGGMANPSLATSIGSTYKITVDATSNTSLKVTVEQTSASLTPTLQMFFDAVPYDLTFDGTAYTTTATATADGVAKFLFKDSNGTYWSKKAAVALDTEVTLASSADVPVVTSIDSVQEGYVYQFTATPTFNGDGDEISSMKLEVVALSPIQDYKYIVGGFGNTTIDTLVYPSTVSGTNTFYKLPDYVVNGTEATTSFVFEYGAGDTWGGDNQNLKFKFLKVVDGWSDAKGSNLGNDASDGEVGGEYAELTGGDNVVIDGFENGKTYKLTVKTTSTTVSVKVEEVN